MKPEVELINYTDDAINVLVFTKSTRLAPGTTFEDVKNMSPDDKHDHIEYMFGTIKSAFEFIDYVFHIKGVSRNFTHQLVRTRNASYNQQSMRVVDASDFPYKESIDSKTFHDAIQLSFEYYKALIKEGHHVQDARDVLAGAVQTEITMKVDLRNLAQMAELRLCFRTQGEYQEIFKMMVEKVLEVHPWAKSLLEVYCVKYAICAFPKYNECPIKKFCFDPSTIRDRIRYEWKHCNYVAKPIAKNAMTM